MRSSMARIRDPTQIRSRALNSFRDWRHCWTHHNVHMLTLQSFSHMQHASWRRYVSRAWFWTRQGPLHRLKFTGRLTWTAGERVTKCGQMLWSCLMPLISVHCRHTSPESKCWASDMGMQKCGLSFIKRTHVHRLEHLPRKRLELLKEHQDATSAGGATAYEPDRPWNLSLSCVAKDDRFWAHEFIEPAMIILSEGKGVRPPLDEDARVSPQHDKSRSVSAAAAGAVRPRNHNRTGRVHDLVDGQYRSNRTGHQLCADYNAGKCTSTVQGSWCGTHQNKAHQCARCLGTHPLTTCPHTEPPQPGWIKNAERSKGKGRGKGRGRGRHKGAAPYWLDDTAADDMRVSHHGTTDLADRLLEEPARDVPDCMDDHIRVVQTDSDGIQSKHKKCLYLYSGPSREDSLEHFLHQHGWDCENIDIEATVSTDLLDSDAWDSLFHRICCGEFDAAFASPPCGTFSAARTGEGGPRQLRGPVLPDLNGLPNLTEAEKHDDKAGNVLADRAAEAMKWFADNLRPWGVEQPARRDGKPSLFNLQKSQQLASRDDARFNRFSQCHFGSKFGKSTEILGNLDMGSWPSDCNHPSQTWVVPWSGQRCTGPHPPLKGKQIAIPESEWVPCMLKHFEPSGPYLTKATAHYPGLLNKQIASAVASTVLRGVKRKISDVSQPSGRNFADLPTPRLKVGNCFPHEWCRLL